ncbi:hypothetical protein [Mesorhizobium erdmanii]|nr:hypothetical protein [Mesorhizobium erdmanii]
MAIEAVRQLAFGNTPLETPLQGGMVLGAAAAQVGADQALVGS